MIMSVLAAAAIVIVAAVSLNGNNDKAPEASGASNDGVNDTTDEGKVNNTDVPDVTALGEASSSQMAIIVHDVIMVNDTEGSPLEVLQAPMEGNQYAILSVSVTNNLSEALDLSVLTWSLGTSDDLMSPVTENVASDAPTEIFAGSTAIFHLAFEIVSGETSTMLECSGMETLTVEFK